MTHDLKTTPEAMREAAALASCLFCGGDALHIFASAGLIACRRCGAQTSTFRTREDAIAAWNRRADLSVQAAAKVLLEASTPLLTVHMPDWPQEWREGDSENDGGVVGFRMFLRILAALPDAEGRG